MTKPKRLPLHKASEEGDIERVKFLISKGADVNKRDNSGSTPLHSAAMGYYEEQGNIFRFISNENHFQIAKMLIENGTNVNLKSDDGWTPLHYAATTGNIDMIRLILAKSLDINSKTNSGGYTPLYLAISRIKNEETLMEVIRTLYNSGAVVNIDNNRGNSPLHEAACHGYKNVVEFIISVGGDVNEKNHRGYTPLHEAVRGLSQKLLENQNLSFNIKQKYINTIELLIKNSANINELNDMNQTPIALLKSEVKNRYSLRYFFTNEDPNFKKMLILLGASPDEEFEDGESLLITNVDKIDNEVISDMTSRETDINRKNDKGFWGIMNIGFRLFSKKDKVSDLINAIKYGSSQEKLKAIIISCGKLSKYANILLSEADFKEVKYKIFNYDENERSQLIQTLKEMLELNDNQNLARWLGLLALMEYGNINSATYKNFIKNSIKIIEALFQVTSDELYTDSFVLIRTIHDSIIESFTYYNKVSDSDISSIESLPLEVISDHEHISVLEAWYYLIFSIEIGYNNDSTAQYLVELANQSIELLKDFAKDKTKEYNLLATADMEFNIQNTTVRALSKLNKSSISGDYLKQCYNGSILVGHQEIGGKKLLRKSSLFAFGALAQQEYRELVEYGLKKGDNNEEKSAARSALKLWGSDFDSIKKYAEDLKKNLSYQEDMLKRLLYFIISLSPFIFLIIGGAYKSFICSLIGVIGFLPVFLILTKNELEGKLEGCINLILAVFIFFTLPIHLFIRFIFSIINFLLKREVIPRHFYMAASVISLILLIFIFLHFGNINQFLSNIKVSNDNERQKVSGQSIPQQNNISGNNYYVIAGTFSNNNNANKESSRLSSCGFSTIVERSDSFPKLKKGYYVCVSGKYNNKEQAKKRASAIKNAGRGFDAIITER